MRIPPMAVLIALVGGCAAAPSRPATSAERTPSPESVTEENPGGDADSPVDAALSRLLKEPIGHKTDKFKTLRAHFADVGNWKRVRIFAHPTRAAFRYGKNPAYAFAVIQYEPAEDSDAAHACLEQFVTRASSLSRKFDIDLDPIRRSLRKHYRGSESVDWTERQRAEQQRREQAEQAQKQRQAERRKRLEARRRARALAKMRQRIRGSRKRPPPSAAANAERRPRYLRRLERLLRRTERRAHLAAHRATVQGRQPPVDVEVFVLGGEGRRTVVTVSPPFAELAPRPARRRNADRPREKRRRPELTAEQRFERHWKHREKRFGMASMPVARAAGRFQTLFDRDEYVGALVAYDSWPGTCLVQGFAVKVGTDPALADQVVERWIAEMAPRLMWEDELRRAPEFKNR